MMHAFCHGGDGGKRYFYFLSALFLLKLYLENVTQMASQFCLPVIKPDCD